MTRQFQEPTLFSNVANTFINHMVYISIFVSTFDPSFGVRLCRMQLPIQHDIFNHQCVCNNLLKHLLTQLYIPINFILGHDCDLVPNLSTRLRESVLHRSRVHINYFQVFIMVFQSHCCYNVVGTPFIFLADGLPSRGLVQRMACDGGEHLSLPAGATTLERFMVEDEQEDPCAICIKDFNSGDNAARLPCSHVFHPDCILQWFVQKTDELPSREMVQRMTCDGGEHSLPAGAMALKRFLIQDEQEDPCAICIKDFNSGDNAARLPCSHVFHPDCILQWFVQKKA
ncbi:hypothetical protein JHK86_051175 [Glycine max]|nr:hypothetical protein JHK86_051175 [Glycine max]